MEIAALISFLVLVVTWMVLPTATGRVHQETPTAIIRQRAGAEA